MGRDEVIETETKAEQPRDSRRNYKESHIETQRTGRVKREEWRYLSNLVYTEGLRNWQTNTQKDNPLH